MAINTLLGKIKDKSEEVTGIVTNVIDKKGRGLDSKSINAIKSEIKSLLEDRSKMYQFIGMEVYDLYTSNKVKLEQLDSFYEKLDTINSQIKDLENEKQIQENKKNKSTLCDCGFKLKKEQQFCPQCGTSVQMMLEGESEEKLIEDEVVEVECVCGAIVSSEGSMCMECGRKIR